jgi:hypothetical protein
VVSRWLGHHNPSFSLGTYAHLLDDGVGGPLDLASANGAQTSAAFGAAGPAAVEQAESAS